MLVIDTAIPEVKIIEPKVFEDHRGFFMEIFNARHFEELTKQDVSFVQDNYSRSNSNVLRGLHYQIQQSQGKLVRVTHGTVYDVAVDIRKSSPTFGKWVGVELSEENKRQMWIPQGFAHGFIVCSGYADFMYKTTDYYAAEHERCIQWDDPTIGILWPVETEPILSSKDQQGLPIGEAELFA